MPRLAHGMVGTTHRLLYAPARYTPPSPAPTVGAALHAHASPAPTVGAALNTAYHTTTSHTPAVGVTNGRLFRLL
ncbi:hypothetical protein [Chloroflexus sp.]|uniref:hypothetical protein n=1 Tax=Chloroflexus sp. TaxID=1904827 RepID=UPI003D140F63